MQTLRFLSAAVLLLGLALPASAANHEVRMLNMIERDGRTEYMVFEPAFLRVEPGDTVTFVATDLGHNSMAELVPEGAEIWKSDLGENFSVTLDRDGVYVYSCEPHIALAMIGVIQVGEPLNLASVREDVETLKHRFAVNQDRVERYLARVNP